jgi:hypothetical protein
MSVEELKDGTRIHGSWSNEVVDVSTFTAMSNTVFELNDRANSNT